MSDKEEAELTAEQTNTILDASFKLHKAKADICTGIAAMINVMVIFTILFGTVTLFDYLSYVWNN